MPLLGPIMGAVGAWTGALLGTDTGSLTFNATLPWFALGSVLAAFAIAGGAFVIMGTNLTRGR